MEAVPVLRFGQSVPLSATSSVATWKATTPSVPLDIIEAVPRICEFYGIMIFMYYGDHPPPHFHASYGDDSAKVDLATGAIIAGSLPGRALRLVREWLEQHRDQLEANWERALRHERPQPIEPLT